MLTAVSSRPDRVAASQAQKTLCEMLFVIILKAIFCECEEKYLVDSVPSPALFAQRAARPPATAADVASRFHENFSALAGVCAQLDLEPAREIAQWIEEAGIDTVTSWLDVTTSGFDFATNWSRTQVSERHPSLFECLVIEEHLCTRVEAIGPYARAHGAGLATMISKARERLGNAALYRARKMTTSKRFVLLRNLELARQYLQFAFDASDKSFAHSSYARARVGMVTVLSARYGYVDLENLRRAIAELEIAFDDGNDNAFGYLLEALAIEYDVTRNPEALVRARALDCHDDVLALADVNLRLAGEAANARVGRPRC